jgi:pimeloyl-ACP methyl ester carboxylesterase
MNDPTILTDHQWRKVSPFGRLPLVPEIDVFGVPTPNGILTAFRAPAIGKRRGTVLCIPGFTGSKEDFRLLLPSIAALGWDAFAYSQRGQADSVAPEGVDNYRLDDLAGDALVVARYIGAAADPVHVVGHSLGGLVARAAVLRQPQLFVDLTMLCSGPGGREGVHQADAEFAEARGLLALWEAGQATREETGAGDDAHAGDETHAADEFVRDRFIASSLDNYLGLVRILQSTPDDRRTPRGEGSCVGRPRGRRRCMADCRAEGDGVTTRGVLPPHPARRTPA